MRVFGRLCAALLIGGALTAGGSDAWAQGWNIFQPKPPAQPQQQQQQKPQRPVARPAQPQRSGGLFPAPPPPRTVQPQTGKRQVARPPSPSPFGQPPQRPQPTSAQPNRFRLFDFFGNNNNDGQPQDRPSGWPFGEGRIRVPPPRTVPVQPQAPAATAPVRQTPPKPVKPPVEITAWIYVLGDSIAENLAVGLNDALDDRPEVAVRRRIRPPSGLIEEGDEDWPKVAAEIAGLDKLTYVVIEIGTRDNQPFMDGDREIPLLSDEWKQRYAARVDAVLEPFKAKGTKVFWVGAPPMRDEELSADLVAINDIIKERVTLAGQTYIDVWEGFVNESDAYSQTGPDLDGREVRLRLNDGMHFTRAGSRKFAHYVERDIRRDLDGGGKPGELQLPEIPSVSSDDGRPAGPIIVLTAPAVSSNGQLVGEGAPQKEVEEIERVLVRGEAPTPVVGRLDDAEWHPPGAQPVVRVAGEPFGPPINPRGPVVAGANSSAEAYGTATPSEARPPATPPSVTTDAAPSAPQ